MPVSAVKVVDPFDPVTAEFIQNPYPYYRVLREHEPVFWSESRRWWILTKYEDVLMAFRDPRIAMRPEPPLHRLVNSIPARLQCPVAKILDFIQQPKGSWLPGRNPPMHSHMKRLFSVAFSPPRLEALKPFINDLCDGLLTDAIDRGEFDIMRDYAVQIPFAVIVKVIGLPSEDLPQIKHWCRSIGEQFDLGSSPEDVKVADSYVEECTNYLLPFVKKRRKDPQEDLVSDMLRVDKDGFGLTDRQVAANVVLFTLAGFETTEGLIGNGMLSLLQYPEQLKLLKENPSFVEVAVEEMIRYDTPGPFEPRIVSEKVEIRGKTLKPGDCVIPVTSSANRDESIFDNPDVFDMQRKNLSKHLGFGVGVHFCIGAPLARLEGHIAINRLVQRMPKVKLAFDSVVYDARVRPRKLQSLPVEF